MADTRKQQLRILKKNLAKAQDTVTGKKYNFRTIKSYSAFKKQVPFHTYADIEKEINQIKNKSADVLWPGRIQNFAVSSGTTGKGKHLPLSNERLTSDYRFMRRIVTTYLKQKTSLSIWGPQLSLPGSVEYNEEKNYYIGEISGFLAKMVPFYLRPFQVLPTEKLVRMSWREKFDLCLETAVKKDIRVINAVPTWTLILFQKALELTGKKYIAEVWPNLKLVTGGGVSLRIYKESLQKLCGPLQPDFIEFYGASEGYFAFTQAIHSEELSLVTDNGIFFEWYPYDKLNSTFKNDLVIPTWQVKPKVPYVLIITNNSGLWRYPVNDIVEFTDTSKLKMRVIGRVSDLLDDYGEALYYTEAEKALSDIAKQMGINYRNFLLSAQLDNEFDKPRHLWFIHWETPPTDLTDIAKQLDCNLQKQNRHYAIRRESGALDKPKLFNVNDDILTTWINSGKGISAQTKVPHIIHDDTTLKRLIRVIRDYGN